MNQNIILREGEIILEENVKILVKHCNPWNTGLLGGTGTLQSTHQVTQCKIGAQPHEHHVSELLIWPTLKM